MMDYGAKGGNFKIAFNPTTRNLEFEVLVPRNTWFGIAFGPNMFNVDVLWFSAGQTAQVSQALDMFAFARAPPKPDDRQDIAFRATDV